MNDPLIFNQEILRPLVEERRRRIQRARFQEDLLRNRLRGPLLPPMVPLTRQVLSWAFGLCRSKSSPAPH
jgi:hypothetical protein